MYPEPLTVECATKPPVLMSTLLRDREALMTVSGTVDRPATVQIATLLRGLCDAGASRVLLDLSRVSSCHRSLPDALGTQRRRLAVGGGWLVVDGSPATLGEDLDLPLVETFRIYQEVCTGATAVGC